MQQLNVYLNFFSLIIVINNGVLKRLKLAARQGREVCENIGVTAITIKQVASAFVFLATGYGTAVVFVIMEKCMKTRQRQKHVRRQEKIQENKTKQELEPR